MDDIVKQAMAKWPSVPAVYGWLGLDRRGQWLIKGSPISNPVVTEFMNRNYEHDAAGRWYFQNGPQRVFVNLAYAPMVYRLADKTLPGPLRLETHGKKPVARVESAWIDDAGVVLLTTEYGVGTVDDRDLDRLVACFCNQDGDALSEDEILEAIERLQRGEHAQLHFRYHQARITVQAIAARDVPAKFNFVQRPVQPKGSEECY